MPTGRKRGRKPLDPTEKARRIAERLKARCLVSINFNSIEDAEAFHALIGEDNRREKVMTALRWLQRCIEAGAHPAITVGYTGRKYQSALGEGE